MTTRLFKQLISSAWLVLGILCLAGGSEVTLANAEMDNIDSFSWACSQSDTELEDEIANLTQDKPAPSQDKPAEETYKNIQIFKGLPSSGVMRAMNFFTRSLGVDCTHCHVPGEFEKDDKAAKQTARKM